MASFGSGESACVVAVNGSIGLPHSCGDLGTVSCAQQRNGHWLGLDTYFDLFHANFDVANLDLASKFGRWWLV